MDNELPCGKPDVCITFQNCMVDITLGERVDVDDLKLPQKCTQKRGCYCTVCKIQPWPWNGEKV